MHKTSYRMVHYGVAQGTRASFKFQPINNPDTTTKKIRSRLVIWPSLMPETNLGLETIDLLTNLAHKPTMWKNLRWESLFCLLNFKSITKTIRSLYGLGGAVPIQSLRHVLRSITWSLLILSKSIKLRQMTKPTVIFYVVVSVIDWLKF